MKIEVGKYYKTRGGKKAEIYKKITSLDIRESGYEGRIFYTDDSCMNLWWSEEGRHDPDGGESIEDLIEGWDEEVEKFHEKICEKIERYLSMPSCAELGRKMAADFDKAWEKKKAKETKDEIIKRLNYLLGELNSLTASIETLKNYCNEKIK